MTGGHAAVATLLSATVAIGFACGSGSTHRRRSPELPAAGTARDDGTGLLARWSAASPLVRNHARGRGGSRYGGTEYGMFGGALYGGAGAAGGTAYGGSRYANYQYSPVAPTESRTPAPRRHAEPYQVAKVSAPGAIVGTVRWPRPPRAAAALPSTPGPGDRCPETIANDTLAVDSRGRLANAVVYLDGIERGRDSEPIGGVLERTDCRLRPHIVVVAPIGAPLIMTNSDRDAQSFALVSRRTTPVVHRLDVDGGGGTARADLVVPGFYEARSERSGDRATAWVIVPPHPYYAVTDERGAFRFDDVPAGTYIVRVWHEPVDTGHSRTRATVASKSVRVSARKTTTVSLALP